MILYHSVKIVSQIYFYKFNKRKHLINNYLQSAGYRRTFRIKHFSKLKQMTIPQIRKRLKYFVIISGKGAAD